MLHFSNHVNTIIEKIRSVPSLSSVLEFVCDYQQAPATKSLIANGFVFVVIVNNIANLFAAVSELVKLNRDQKL